MWPSRLKKKNTLQMSPVKQRQVLIPLMNRGQTPIEQKLAQIQKNMSNPSRNKLFKINDASYIPKIERISKFELFCDKLDKKYKILSPDSRFYLIWNIMLIISILYNFFQIPISLFLTQQVYIDQFTSPGWIFINIFLLHVILVDTVVVRWNVAFYQGGELITRRYSIIKKYIKYEVYLDLISFLVLLAYISADYHPLVYVKLLFYLKIFSLYKIDKTLINYLQLHNILYLVYVFFRIFFTLLFIVAWIATVYFAIDYHYYLQQGSYYQNSQLWLTDTLGGVDFIQDLAWPYWLLYAAYWASQISATIGYGVGTPRNPITVAYCSFVIVLMTVIFALFINTIWGIISQISQSSVQYYQSWSSLNKILKQKKISQQLKIRVSQYFHQVWKYNDIKQNSSITQYLSENLKQQLLTLSHLHIFHDIPLFQQWEKQYKAQWIQFKMKIFQSVQNQQLAQGEVLKLQQQNDHYLYCVLKGRIVVSVKVADKCQEVLYKVNERFGFQEFFMQKPLTYTAHADCFTRVCKLPRSKFIKQLKQFPTLYFEYVKQIELMHFSADRSVLGQKCWFCYQSHTPFQCPTKSNWRQHIIRRQVFTSHQLKKIANTIDQSQNERKKIYRNFAKSEKIYKKKLCSEIQIDQIQTDGLLDQKKNALIYIDAKSKFNF